LGKGRGQFVGTRQCPDPRASHPLRPRPNFCRSQPLNFPQPRPNLPSCLLDCPATFRLNRILQMSEFAANYPVHPRRIAFCQLGDFLLDCCRHRFPFTLLVSGDFSPSLKANRQTGNIRSGSVPISILMRGRATRRQALALMPFVTTRPACWKNVTAGKMAEAREWVCAKTANRRSVEIRRQL